MTFVEAALDADPGELEDTARLLAALGQPIRLRIVRGLIHGDCCVGTMVDCLGLPQPLVSRHLAVLREAGVVSVEQEGRNHRYRVTHPRAEAVIRALERP